MVGKGIAPESTCCFTGYMLSFDNPACYGEAWAETYDDQFDDTDVTSMVDLLAECAGKGRVLELAIGTGRVALPLTERGVQVEGVDSSDAMVSRMRAKPGGQDIPVVIGDMADVPVPGPFRLVFVVANSLFGLLTQARQVACFQAVSDVLEPDGRFVLECFVPDPSRFSRGQRVQTLAVSETAVRYEFSRHDPVGQRVDAQNVTVDQDGKHLLRPVAVRYAWPSELDLMAQLAGLRLEARYGGWDRRPFDASCGMHISVYARS